MPAFLPILVIGAVAATLVLWMAQSHSRTAQSARLDWKELVATLQPMHVEGLRMVARDFLEPSYNQLKLEPSEIWGLAGGWEGLNRMRQNAAVMLALAAYTQRWNFEEGVIVAERMRRDALKLRAAAWRLQRHRVLQSMGIFPTRFGSNIPFEVHEVASAYYLMRQRLLALYETSHAGLYPLLAASI